MQVSIDHVVLEVRDVEASARFYNSLLGFPLVRVDDFAAGKVPFASVRVNGKSLIDFFPKTMWRKKSAPCNPNHLCFTMDKKQIDALKGRMKRQGVIITHTSPKSYGAQGYGRAIYFLDPDGIPLEARYYP